MTSIAEGKPGIFVGNLIGGIPVIFLLIIPVLAIFGNGIKLNHGLNTKNILFSLGVIVAPSIAILDKKVTSIEGIVIILLYIILVLFIQRKHGFLDNNSTQTMNIKAYSYKDLLKILAGIAVMFIASQIIVDKTLYFSDFFKIPPFYISLIVLSLGTNLPEMSLAIRSVISGKKDIALGDYVGSAAANALLFGVFTLLNGGEVLTIDNFFTTFVFVAGGLIMFFVFSRSQNTLPRSRGYILIVFYFLFALFQLKG